MKLWPHGMYLVHGKPQEAAPAGVSEAEARRGTIAWGILEAHNTSGDMDDLRMKFDSMTSHDITYVGIIQTARASGMERFPLPYVMTNCHNSLCAVGGTINEDDHQFALSAAHKYGGIYVPPNMAVIHSYNREMMAALYATPLGLLGELMSTAAVFSSSRLSSAAKSIWKSSTRGGATRSVRPAPST